MPMEPNTPSLPVSEDPAAASSLDSTDRPQPAATVRQQAPHDDPDPSPPADRLVPVTEAIRYRKRAQTAEQQLEAFKGQLQDTQVELEQARQSLTALDRRQRIDQILAESDAIDLEVARLLTESAVEVMDEPDIKLAVEDLQRHKPYLFRHRSGSATGSAMTARSRDGVNPTTQHAAQQAAATGDRRDLLKYLRLRRRG